MKTILFQLIFIFLSHFILAQTPNVNWAFESSARSFFNSLAIDGKGDLYVTGTISGSVDVDPGPNQLILSPADQRSGYVCKFSSSGKLLWGKTYGGSGNLSSDVITVDSVGNIFIAGSFSLTVDIDPSAAQYTISTPTQATFIAKLNPSGLPIWAYVADQGPVIGTTQNDIIRSIAIDKYGNLSATGEFQTTTDFEPGPGTQTFVSQGNPDVFILRLRSNGAFHWARAIGTSTSEYARDIIYKDDGSIFVIGQLSGATDLDPNAGVYNVNVSPQNMFVVCLDSSANFNWAGVLGASNSYANTITEAPSGNILIGGGYSGTADFDPGPSTQTLSSQYPAGYIWELTGNGTYVSTLNFPTIAGQGTFIDLTTDKFGNMYACGMMWGTVDFDPGAGSFPVTSTYSQTQQAFLTKLSPTGNLIWAGALESQQTVSAFNVAVDKEALHFYANGAYSGIIDLDPGATSHTLNSMYPQYPVSSAYFVAFCQGVPMLSSAIMGPSVICQGQNATYSINPAFSALSYSWTLSNCINGNSDSISVNASAVAACNGTVSIAAVNACGESQKISKYVEVSACTDITEIKYPQNFNLYPNPSTGNFNLQNFDGHAFILRISDCQGRVLQALEFSGKEEICSFLIPDKGIYLCEIIVNTTSIAKKKAIVAD